MNSLRDQPSPRDETVLDRWVADLQIAESKLDAGSCFRRGGSLALGGGAGKQRFDAA